MRIPGPIQNLFARIAGYFQRRSQSHQSDHRSNILNTQDFARFIQVVSAEPTFFAWFQCLGNLPQEKRIVELRRMAENLRRDPDNQDLAGILEHLQSPTIYKSFCQVLQDEQELKQV